MPANVSPFKIQFVLLQLASLALRINSPVCVQQVLEEVVEAVLPGQPQRAPGQEGGHRVAQHVVQPALAAQLAHGRVHEREPGAALAPSTGDKGT